MPVGTPRVLDRDEVGKELIDWSKEETSINLCDFCCSRSYLLDPMLLVNWARTDEKFAITYRIAKTHLGSRRERLLNEGKFHTKTYEMNANTYDYFLREEKRDQCTFESDLKVKEGETKPTSITIVVDKDGLGTGLKV